MSKYIPTQYLLYRTITSTSFKQLLALNDGLNIDDCSHFPPLLSLFNTHKKPRLSLLVYYHLALYFILPPSIDSSHQKVLHRKKTGRKFCLKVTDPEAKPFAVDNYINGGATGNLTFFCLEPYCELTPSSSKNLRLFSSFYFFRSEIGRNQLEAFSKTKIWARAVILCTSSFNEEL